ncbi:MAG: 4Fe-4S binding protein, partial [Pseudomonadota bacterium]
GDYSWRGSGYVRGGIFDRIELDQGDETIRFRDRNYARIGDVEAEGAPDFPEIGLFTLPEGASFEPAAPWRLQLLVQRAVGALEKRFLTFEVSYQVPEDYLLPAPTETAAAPVAPAEVGAAGEPEEPLWVRVWKRSWPQIAVLAAALGLLTVVFYFQDWLVKRPRLTHWVRTGFLVFTLVWLGWLANAQLSVVNILTLTNSLITGFSWDYFLMDPLLFILWAGVAAALILWGRGVFCGWLCPFGALQEFVNRAAKALRIPQVSVPWGVHERLWTLKYVIFIGLFGVALYQLAFAERLAEVEPFKTAIILKFVRDWPFVVYAVLLLAAGLFIERFFCRYLCPLGAALAIPARLRTMEWLKRHRECGNPCQRCANECPVQSIHPLGQINPNECIYCMHCQTLYWDEHRCPHMIQVRLKRERRAAMGAPPPVDKRRAGGIPEQGTSAFDPVEWTKQGGSDHGQ